MNKVCVSVCPSESKWVLMFGLAVFPGMESALSLITTRWCALEAVSVYEAKEELHTALKLHAEFTHLHGLQMPFFFQDEKKKKNAACDGSTRKVSKTMCNPWFASHPLEVLCLVSAEDCAVGLLIAHFKRCDSGLHGPRLTPRNSCGWAAVDMLWLTRNPTLHQTHSKWWSASSLGINLHPSTSLQRGEAIPRRGLLPVLPWHVSANLGFGKGSFFPSEMPYSPSDLEKCPYARTLLDGRYRGTSWPLLGRRPSCPGGQQGWVALDDVCPASPGGTWAQVMLQRW